MPETKMEAEIVFEPHIPDALRRALQYAGNDGFNQGIADLPIRYGVIRDFEMASKANSGYQAIEALKDDPNMIVQAGGVEATAAYLDKFCDRHNTKYGVTSNESMFGMSRYVAVAPRDVSTDVRNVEFEL